MTTWPGLPAFACAAAFAYDNMGRLIGTTTTYSFLNTPFTNSYSYDADSNRTGFTAPDSSTNTYTYDTLNRLTTLANSWAGSFGFSYDAMSRRTQMTRPNGIATNYAYDKLSHLLSVLHQAGSSTIDGASYTLDAAGNRTAKTDDLAGVTSNYTYDKIYELTQTMQGTNTTESYNYDPVGNRTASLGVSSYTNNTSNELTSTSNASYAYDSNGNLTSKTDSTGTTNYTWDFENRLAQVTLPGTVGAESYRYDPFGRRIQKVFTQNATTTTTNYLYDGDNAVETADQNGSVVAKYAQGQNIDEPLAESTAGATSFYEQDGLGSVTSLTNSSGALALSYTYDSFGKITASSGSVTNPFRYTGRDFDSETGLYYYRARYYDPSTGRFVSEDPIGFISSANFYDYVDNNPIDLADPIGNDPCLDINKFVNNLNHNAHQSPSGWCGRHIYWALKAGGLGKVGSLNGKDFGQPLVENGFTPESPDNYEPQPGDIAVIQPYPGGNQAGHVEGWNGSQWVSDFFQPYRPNLPGHGIYPGPGYRKFQPPFKIYRPTPCPTSPPAEQDLLQGMITWIANLFD